MGSKPGCKLCCISKSGTGDVCGGGGRHRDQQMRGGGKTAREEDCVSNSRGGSDEGKHGEISAMRGRARKVGGLRKLSGGIQTGVRWRRSTGSRAQGIPREGGTVRIQRPSRTREARGRLGFATKTIRWSAEIAGY